VAYELVKASPQGRLRSIDLGRVEVAPVAYFPETGELEVAREIEFALHFEGGDPAAEAWHKASTYSPFFSHLYEGVAGYRDMHDN